MSTPNAGQQPPDQNGADQHSPDPGSDTAQWFLRAGRAGLLPDAMTVSWAEPDAAVQTLQTSNPAAMTRVRLKRSANVPVTTAITA